MYAKRGLAYLPCLYFDQHKSVLYTGMTNYLAKRLYQHKKDIRNKKNTFVARYRCGHLVYYEKFTWVQEAIARDKEIKGWIRKKKLDLIKTINPDMNFLESLFPYQDSSPSLRSGSE